MRLLLAAALFLGGLAPAAAQSAPETIVYMLTGVELDEDFARGIGQGRTLTATYTAEDENHVSFFFEADGAKRMAAADLKVEQLSDCMYRLSFSMVENPDAQDLPEPTISFLDLSRAEKMEHMTLGDGIYKASVRGAAMECSPDGSGCKVSRRSAKAPEFLFVGDKERSQKALDYFHEAFCKKRGF